MNCTHKPQQRLRLELQNQGDIRRGANVDRIDRFCIDLMMIVESLTF